MAYDSNILSYPMWMFLWVQILARNVLDPKIIPQMLCHKELEFVRVQQHMDILYIYIYIYVYIMMMMMMMMMIVYIYGNMCVCKIV